MPMGTRIGIGIGIGVHANFCKSYWERLQKLLGMLDARGGGGEERE